MKRLIAGMAAVLLAAVLVFPLKVGAISAASAIVYDAGTGRVLFEKNAHSQSLIASTTKIMTALLVSENCNVLDRVRIPKEAVGIEGSSIYLQEGEILTVQELLYGLMLHSGNDAAVALAIYCGGTVGGFVELMNEKAHKLGLENTHFENPHGLDAPGHGSTAYDMAVLASYAMDNPIFAQTVSTKTVRAGIRSLRNHNKLLWRLPGADGVKTGFTRSAGRILVSSATRDGRRLICVTFRAPDDWNDHTALLEACFSRFSPRCLVEKGQCLGTKQVAGGKQRGVELIAGEDFVYPLAQGEETSLILQEPGFVYAPVVRGEEAGFAYITVDGAVVGKVPVSYGATVEMEEAKTPGFWERIFGGKP